MVAASLESGSYKMASQKFDQIDLQILGELQKNGRITNVELAQMVGLTAPPCLRRVRALEESGVIRSYHADLDASKLGYGITVFAMVSQIGGAAGRARVGRSVYITVVAVSLKKKEKNKKE